ncbi:hypothetical protein NO2_0591 [Candidatus Termititenax persephonae]|uniref:Uncharacterized protein n=1 Tax=Candidatus Termititenax persephonae TaxID=2218525 RepID=A0A388TH25_9BACT|nr:hypothetical protein NO2_0591 [Candidatus Termititenax persephonae]
MNNYFYSPELTDEPLALREIHAIRLAIHAETKNMNPEEKRAYFHRSTLAFFARRGLSPNYQTSPV